MDENQLPLISNRPKPQRVSGQGEKVSSPNPSLLDLLIAIAVTICFAVIVWLTR